MPRWLEVTKAERCDRSSRCWRAGPVPWQRRSVERQAGICAGLLLTALLYCFEKSVVLLGVKSCEPICWRVSDRCLLGCTTLSCRIRVATAAGAMLVERLQPSREQLGPQGNHYSLLRVLILISECFGAVAHLPFSFVTAGSFPVPVTPHCG